MSHSSGIPVSPELRDSFGSLISGKNRLVKVQIENELLVPITTKPTSGNFDGDLKYIPDLLDAGVPCYVIYKVDSDQPQFVLFFYVPSKSKVKDKMLYASTRSNLKQGLGNNYFIDEVFGDSANDFSAEGYKHHVESKKTEAPLTEQEQIKRNEMETGEIYTGGSSTYVHGVAFPVDSTATNAVKKLMNGELDYVQIAIDCDNERIVVGKTDKGTTIGSLRKLIPLDEPRFHFFNYRHNYDESSVSSFVYLFSCPDGSQGTKSAPVRMRMLYSSSKANVAEIAKSVGGTVAARLEINSGEEIDEEELVKILHPQKAEQSKNFARPARPGKGGARLIRKQ